MRQTFQTKIFQRYMSEKGLKELDHEYSENLQRTRHNNNIATEKDYSILVDYRRGMNMSELAKKYGVSYASVSTSLRIAALAKLS